MFAHGCGEFPCVCVCAGPCAHLQVCVHTFVGPGGDSWPHGATGMADVLSLPSLPLSCPASRPPEGSEAEWRHRYRSVLLGPCPPLHGALLALSPPWQDTPAGRRPQSCPGTFGSSLGTELALPSQASSVSLCFARDDGLSPRSASHPEPGLRAENWHSEKYPHAGTVSAACPPCPLPAGQELCHPAWRRASPPPATLGSQESSHPHLHPS